MSTVMNRYKNKASGEIVVIASDKSTISNKAGEWTLYENRIIVPGSEISSKVIVDTKGVPIASKPAPVKMTPAPPKPQVVSKPVAPTPTSTPAQQPTIPKGADASNSDPVVDADGNVSVPTP